MPAANRDPYKVLGVSRRASDAELHAAYRRLVQLHHPDHNGGSLEAARRFEEVQAAYAEIREQRGRTAGAGQAPRRSQRPGGQASPGGPASGAGQAPSQEAEDPNIESRIADIERRLREARAASERARQAARDATAGRFKRPSDEELGYVRTDDSLGKILADARDELSGRLAKGRDRPVGDRVADLLEELAEKLRGESPRGSGD
jgi:curved DNA-binding protein CbpA